MADIVREDSKSSTSNKGTFVRADHLYQNDDEECTTSTEAEQRSAGSTSGAFNECQGTVNEADADGPCEEKREAHSDGDINNIQENGGHHKNELRADTNHDDAKENKPLSNDDRKENDNDNAKEEMELRVSDMRHPTCSGSKDDASTKPFEEVERGRVVSTACATTTSASLPTKDEAPAPTTSTQSPSHPAGVSLPNDNNDNNDDKDSTYTRARSCTDERRAAEAYRRAIEAEAGVEASSASARRSVNEKPKPPIDCCICGAPPKGLDHSCVLCKAITCSGCVISLKHLACPWCQDTNRNAKSLRNEAAAIRAMNKATEWFSFAKDAVRGVADNVVERTTVKNVEAEKEHEKWRKAYKDEYAVDYAGFGIPLKKST